MNLSVLQLPTNSKVFWNHLPYIAEDDCFKDEDLVYIQLSNGLGIDCGWYGIYRTLVAWQPSNVWVVIEDSYSSTPEEAGMDIERMAAKAASDWYLELANRVGNNLLKRESSEH